jgi:hypothetical protein
MNNNDQQSDISYDDISLTNSPSLLPQIPLTMSESSESSYTMPHHMMHMPPMQYIPRYSDQPLFDHYPQVPSYLDSTALHPNEFDFLTSPDKTTINEESMMTNDVTAVEASMSLSKTAIKRKRLLEGDDSSGNDDRARTHALNSSMATDSQTQSPYKQQLLSTRFVQYITAMIDCVCLYDKVGF